MRIQSLCIIAVVGLGAAPIAAQKPSNTINQNLGAEQQPARGFFPEQSFHRQTLKKLGVAPTREGLAKYLSTARPRPSDEDRVRFRSIVSGLSDPKVKDREALIQTLGQMAHDFVPELERLSKSANDPQVRGELKKIVEKLAGRLRLGPAAAMHVIATDRIKGLTPNVLEALVWNDQPAMRQAAVWALAATAGKDDLPELRRRLESGQPTFVRVVVIEVLGAIDPQGQAPQFVGLLKDPQEPVRLAAARVLAKTGNSAALPVLIELLSSEKLEVRHRASTTLRQWTGQDFTYRAYAKVEDRTKAAARWRMWLSKRDPQAPLAALKPPVRRGRVLAVRGDRLVELGPDGKLLHDHKGFKSLSEAMMLPGGDKLVTDFHGWSFYEFDPMWKQRRKVKLSFQPRGCHRLPDGRTLAIGMDVFHVLDRRGEVISKIPMRDEAPNMTGSLYLAGDRFLVTSNDRGVIVESDLEGEVHWKMQAENHPHSVQILDDGRLLAADFRQAVIYTPDGKVQWRYPLEGARSAHQLTSGNILLGHRGGLSVINLDKQTLWEWKNEEVRGSGFCAKVN